MTFLSLVLATGCTATSMPEESASAPLIEAWVVVVAADDDPNELEDELPAPAPVDGVFREVVPTACYVPTSGDADLSAKGYVVVLRGESEQSVARPLRPTVWPAGSPKSMCTAVAER